MAYLSVTVDKNNFFKNSTSTTSYIGYKPKNYSESTPIPLFIWAHGCGGNAEGDLWSVKSDDRVVISLGGRDGACWQTGIDGVRVIDAINDVKKYFNVDMSRIYLGGYSSGGDLTYRVGLERAELFAALLVENSSPASAAAKFMNTAAWKINIIHLAHTGDTTFPIAGVRNAMTSLKNAGFPATLIEKPGTHWDNDKGTTGTNYDLVNILLPYLDKNLKNGTITPPVVNPPEPSVKTAVGIVKSSTSLSSPGDQGFRTSKTIPDGYNIPAGTYNLTVATKTTFSDDNTVVVTCIMYGDNGVNYDLTWQSMDIDLRGAVLGAFWDCTITEKSGIITVKPTSSTKTIKANNKNGFGFVFTRNVDKSKANWQVLVKNVVW